MFFSDDQSELTFKVFSRGFEAPIGKIHRRRVPDHAYTQWSNQRVVTW
ncbi:hypothetical protein Hjap01_03050 [Haloarcula japonica]